MAERFTIERHSTIDKRFAIEDAEDEIKLLVDFDDVDHKTVDRAASKVVRILNKYWDKE